VQRREGAPWTHPGRSRFDRNPDAFAEPAVLINKPQSARPEPLARTPRAARLLHRKPERIAVLGKRPAMRETEMSAADRSEPTAAQVALHLVLIGVIGQLAQPPEICRAIVDPQSQIIQHDDGFNQQQRKPEIDGFEPATAITTMTCSTSPPAQTSTTASPQSRNKLVEGRARIREDAAVGAIDRDRLADCPNPCEDGSQARPRLRRCCIPEDRHSRARRVLLAGMPRATGDEQLATGAGMDRPRLYDRRPAPSRPRM
jgi:hypothetical protein